jgi:hypothetical protein
MYPKNKMKKILYLITGVVILVVAGLTILYFWNSHTVKSNIRIAQEKYGGAPEEALIAYLMDETNGVKNRTHLAIWTLGQIESEKALPVLKGLYRDDPEGETCYGKHDSMLCQYEIHKAIQSIEKKRMFSFIHLKKSE